MMGLTTGMLAAVAIGGAVLFPDFKLTVILLLLLFPLLLAALAGLPMLLLLQRLLIAVGIRAGRPASFLVFRRWLRRYSAVLAAWALATILVWHYNARRLYLEREAGGAI